MTAIHDAVVAELKAMSCAQREEFANRHGIPLGTIEKITYGATPNPRVKTVEAIAHGLGMHFVRVHESVAEQIAA